MKYLILGAGPAGLTFANYLMSHGERSFLILEKEKEAGGLCRSVNVDDSPLDIGGGHFLDVRDGETTAFLFQFMPENEWNRFRRNSQIHIHDTFINSPIEANIWQLPLDEQVEYLKSIAVAGCNLGIPQPEKFIHWINWKLGDRIADRYMIPYNVKVFSKSLDELGTYWLDKLPNVSFDQTLMSCLERKAYGTQPGHTEFLYPRKYGYGELWLRMGDKIKNNIQYNVNVSEFDFTKNEINGTFKADCIISTIPWQEFSVLKGMPEELQLKIRELKHSSISVEYFNKNMETDAHWIYYPDMDLSYHRILIRHNFCNGAKGCWTETNLERTDKSTNMNKFINKYAYPLNTIKKPVIMQEILNWIKTKNIYGLGRWGEHQHYNSDVTVKLSINLAKKLLI